MASQGREVGGGREGEVIQSADVDRFAAEFRASKPHKVARGREGMEGVQWR